MASSSFRRFDASGHNVWINIKYVSSILKYVLLPDEINHDVSSTISDVIVMATFVKSGGKRSFDELEAEMFQPRNYRVYQQQVTLVLYEKDKAEAQRITASAVLFAQQQSADGELFTKKRETEGLMALAEA
ncbi:hypothetical protein GIB67_015388 [Kingdonia uniflora]|uniref:Uncharacterized protein n=1 Tax=Kingdonia uniflora TaxID=39325 RepID=A0A7J7KYT8_9MAGN|nr:hypothetical protein GIB67_015388 [Kingdonia uniflora]